MSIELNSGNAFTDVVEGAATLSRPGGFGLLISSFGLLNPGLQDFRFRCGSCEVEPTPIPDEFSVFLAAPDGSPLFGTADPLAANAAFAICIDGTLDGVRQVFTPATFSDPTITLITPSLDSIPLFGVAAGGSVELTVDGVVILVATSPGQTASEVLVAIAEAINDDPTLAGQLVRAHVADARLVSSGAISNVILNDSGLSQFVAVPSMQVEAMILLVLLMLTSGIAVIFHSDREARRVAVVGHATRRARRK
jgi:hypothetical protein